MTVDRIIEMQSAQPFRPDRLWLADGRHTGVHHPEFVARSPAGRTIAVFSPDDRFEFIDPLLVVSVEVLANGKPRTSRSKGNGPNGRGRPKRK